MPRKYTCSKCGSKSEEDATVTFHRFPFPSIHGSLKARVWAMYCFPNDDWTSDQSLHRLFKSHKMLCGKHFDESSFCINDKNHLNKYAIPVEARGIMAELRNQQQYPERNIIPEPHINLRTPENTATSHSTQIIPEPDMRDPRTPEDTATSHSTQIIPEPDMRDPRTPEDTATSHRTQGVCKKKGLLKEIDVKSLTELTPRENKLYKRCRQNIVEILRLRRKIKKTKKCNRTVLQSLNSDSAVNNIIKSKMGSSFYLLMQSQLKNSSRKLSGRRWTLEDKVLALSMYKRSSSCYRLLRRLFCLPSISSLKAILNKIPLKCGISEQIIETIKEITTQRSDNDNLCVLAFDEMSIRKNVIYNLKSDQFDGYQDHAGQGRTSEIATHALTFMAIGIRKTWKQPIAYYFSGSCVTADRLAVLIKEVLTACFSAGLNVIGTVCDLDGVNIRAINYLGSTNERPYFEHEGHEIVTILDPPHLLKCFRNNFLKYNIQFTQDIQINGQQSIGIAKWSHIEDFFKMEKENPNFVFAPALTQQHLQPNGKQKMKVRLAAQVLSHSVASGLFAKTSAGALPQEAIATATVASNMDKLFDCMNGNTADRKKGKLYLTNMTSTSPHIQFFSKMKDFFKNMKFLGARCNPPSQEGWLRTLNGMERIFYNLKKHDINSLSLKMINQDPLENCFGCIRSNCGSNPNPTSVQFTAALKTSIITNLINHNKNRNCADDNNYILNNFKIFLEKGCEQEKIVNSSAPITQVIQGAEEVENIVNSSAPITQVIEGAEEVDVVIPQCSGEIQACAYVSGFIAKHLDISCEGCKNVLLTVPNTEVCHLFTSFKEYDKETRLNYVSASFCESVESAANLINIYLTNNAHTNRIKCKLYEECIEKINFDFLRGCELHYLKNKKMIIWSTISICIKRFATLKNRGFAEEVSNKLLSRKIKIVKNV